MSNRTTSKLFAPLPDRWAVVDKIITTTQKPGPHKSSPYLQVSPGLQSPGPIASTKGKGQISPGQCGQPPETTPFPPPAPKLQSNVAGTDAVGTRAMEPPTTPQPPAPPAAAAPRTKHNLSPAGAR